MALISKVDQLYWLTDQWSANFVALLKVTDSGGGWGGALWYQATELLTRFLRCVQIQDQEKERGLLFVISICADTTLSTSF